MNKLLQASAFIALITLSYPHAQAALLLTEIHYNGPGAGIDADEFLELTNVGDESIALENFAFSAGINYVFADILLAPQTPLVLARDPSALASIFPGLTGLLTYTGALSNSGETLTLHDDNGASVFSISYDDRAPWPTSADGGGDSLQLRSANESYNSAEHWIGAAPTPGFWSGQRAQTVPTPSALSLIFAPLLMLLFARLLKRNKDRQARKHHYS